jgi:UDP-GlcNAc:undecaprenyl-phosphate GlcNAc-1-phosphate transferase
MKSIGIETIILLTLSFFMIWLINRFREWLSKKFNLVDKPDKIRKFHSKSVPLLGGIMIYLTFLMINLYSIFFQQIEKTYLIIIICCTGCLIIGLIDDIKAISYKYKFLYLIIFFYIFTSLDENLQINKIYFSTTDRMVYLNYLSTPFTILSLLLLTNALNLIDGLDGLCITISFIFLVWIMITFNSMNNINIIFITSLVFVLYLNLKKKIFLGDSGSLFLGSLIGLNLIFNYNLTISTNYYPVENIFILLMLPGLDMLRVFAIRIINNKNPFTSDRNHLHHLLISKNFNKVEILIIFVFLIVSPILVNFLINIKSIYIIIFYILFYFTLCLKLKI